MNVLRSHRFICNPRCQQEIVYQGHLEMTWRILYHFSQFFFLQREFNFKLDQMQSSNAVSQVNRTRVTGGRSKVSKSSSLLKTLQSQISMSIIRIKEEQGNNKAEAMNSKCAAYFYASPLNRYFLSFFFYPLNHNLRDTNTTSLWV